MNYQETEEKIQEQKDKTYDSTVIRVIENVGNNSTKFLNKITGDDKKNQEK